MQTLPSEAAEQPDAAAQHRLGTGDGAWPGGGAARAAPRAAIARAEHSASGARSDAAHHFAVVPRCSKKLISPGAAPTISAAAPEISAAIRPRAA